MNVEYYDVTIKDVKGSLKWEILKLFQTTDITIFPNKVEIGAFADYINTALNLELENLNESRPIRLVLYIKERKLYIDISCEYNVHLLLHKSIFPNNDMQNIYNKMITLYSVNV
jgi:hypothetical protein